MKCWVSKNGKKGVWSYFWKKFKDENFYLDIFEKGQIFRPSTLKSGSLCAYRIFYLQILQENRRGEGGIHPLPSRSFRYRKNTVLRGFHTVTYICNILHRREKIEIFYNLNIYVNIKLKSWFLYQMVTQNFAHVCRKPGLSSYL